jgi:uncharacterized DUF497 family protein
VETLKAAEIAKGQGKTTHASRRDGKMIVKFFIDPEMGKPHIHNHGVSEAEVRQVLARPGLVLKGREDSRFALGQTEAGRFLKVVYAPRKEGQGIFVITAYELRGKELRAYRRRRRRKL